MMLSTLLNTTFHTLYNDQVQLWSGFLHEKIICPSFILVIVSYTPKFFFYPVLPKLSVISGAHCKIWHTNQAIHCKRCNSDEHRTVDYNKCEAYDAHPSTTVFKFDEDPRSNFFLCKNKFKVFNREWSTSEHSYQWVKLMENGQTELAKEVLTAPTARAAKTVSSRAPAHTITWNDEQKISLMKDIVMAKLDKCGELRDALLGSGNNLLVEGTMDPFWGAGMPHYLAINTRPDKLIGRNELGRLLTELRDQIKDISKTSVSNDINISSSTPTSLITSATDTDLQESQIKQKNTSVILENDIELFPKHLMSHEETTKKKGRSQTKEGKRITNVCNSDRRDMRPIDEYFTPGKRKASGPATSPNSEAATKLTKTTIDVHSSPLAEVVKEVATSDGGHVVP